MSRRDLTHEESRMIDHMVAADFGAGPESARNALADHLDGTPEREATHDSMMRLWDDLGRIDPPALSVEPTAPTHRRRPSWIPAGGWAIAASIVPLFLAVGLIFLLVGNPAGVEPYEIRTGSDERRIVSLADGSTVSLSADTVLAIDLQRDRRALTLKQGEALFAVAHDPQRPFVVGAGNGWVRAIGTAFNIRLAEDVVVTVVEGTVSVTAAPPAHDRDRKPGVSQIATAGQQVRFSEDTGHGRMPAGGGGHISPARSVDAERFTSWASGVLRFQGEPLSQVIAELNRYSANDVHLTDPTIADTPIYGLLHIGDVEGLRSIVRDIERIDEGTAARKLVTRTGS